jgi:hypothetical protein
VADLRHIGQTPALEESSASRDRLAELQASAENIIEVRSPRPSSAMRSAGTVKDALGRYGQGCARPVRSGAGLGGAARLEDDNGGLGWPPGGVVVEVLVNRGPAGP